MSRHQYDLIMCLKQPGTHIARVCDNCDGRCPSCDSFVRPSAKARICEECAFGKNGEKCVVCGNHGVSDAYYCYECVMLEKDRDGCPNILNIGSSRRDIFYEKKKQKSIKS
jgi:PHD finger-like domain-containing protein 5A